LIGFVTWSVDPTPVRTGSQRYTGDYTSHPVEWNDQTVRHPAMQTLKQQNGGLKTVLSIGGWSMAAGSRSRAQFINSVIMPRNTVLTGSTSIGNIPAMSDVAAARNDLTTFLPSCRSFARRRNQVFS
jgi:GH18 family chitinase